MASGLVVRLFALAWTSMFMLGVFATSAHAACEGINNAFAYNECLAKQAPKRGVRAPRVTSGDPEASVVERRGRRSARGLNAGPEEVGGITISRRQGRSSAVIDPWGGIRSSKGRKSRRR